MLAQRRSRDSMLDEDFEWDDAKAAASYARHRVTFDMAREVFADPLAVTRPDRREDYGEDRFNTIGVVDNRVLHVTYALRVTGYASSRREEPSRMSAAVTTKKNARRTKHDWSRLDASPRAIVL
jgi:uncharacterized DUF497 family protein